MHGWAGLPTDGIDLRSVLAILIALAFAGPALSDVTIRSDTLAEDLRAQLEAARPDDPDPETRFEARRQARRVAERLTSLLNSKGYFAARVEPSVEPGPPVRAVVTVDPGPLFRIGQQVVTYLGPAPDDATSRLSQAALGLFPGDAALPDDILAAEQRALAVLREAGYGTARAALRDVLGDAGTARVDVTYAFEAGPRIYLGEVVYDQPIRMRERLQERLVPFDAGDPYTPEVLEEFTERLGATRLYSLFSVRLADDPSGPAGDGQTRDVIVTVTERPRYSIAAGASYATSEGIGVSAELTRRNSTNRGDELRLRTVLAEQERSLGADWLLPHAFGYGRSLTANAFGGREETDAFDRTTLLTGLGLDIDRGNDLRLLFGTEAEYTNETRVIESRDIAVFGNRDFWVLSTSGEARLDKSNSLLDPTEGWRIGLGVEPGVIVGDTNDVFTSVMATASGYQGFGQEDRFVLAGRLRAGAVYGVPTLDLPTSRRFFAGGGGSARGFGFQDIGPRAADNTPLGGRGLLELAGEARWRQSETLGFAAFIDAASVIDDPRPSFNDLRVGIGAGVRYYTAIGPIRLDIATPLNPQPGDNPVQVYISIGQAF